MCDRACWPWLCCFAGELELTDLFGSNDDNIIARDSVAGGGSLESALLAVRGGARGMACGTCLGLPTTALGGRPTCGQGGVRVLVTPDCACLGLSQQLPELLVPAGKQRCSVPIAALYNHVG